MLNRSFLRLTNKLIRRSFAQFPTTEDHTHLRSETGINFDPSQPISNIEDPFKFLADANKPDTGFKDISEEVQRFDPSQGAAVSSPDQALPAQSRPDRPTTKLPNLPSLRAIRPVILRPHRHLLPLLTLASPTRRPRRHSECPNRHPPPLRSPVQNAIQNAHPIPCSQGNA